MADTTTPSASIALITRAQAGDAEALNDLCAFYLPRLQRFARGRLPPSVRGPVDAYDLVQDTFAHVVQRLDAFEPRHDRAFEAYLRQALLNRLRDQLRSSRRRPTESLECEQAADVPSPMDEAIGNETRARYRAALRRLRPVDRDAIVARIELRLPYPEIAKVLRKPTIAAAHVAVSRALVKLAREMAPAPPAC